MLKQGIRPGDAVGRYGGEEFVLVISGAGPESARLVAERHRKTIEGIDFSGVGPKQVTLSIGVAVYEPETSDEGLEELLRRADLALYRAKNTGRNCVLMAPPVAIPSPTLDAVRASRRPPAMTTIESRPPSATATRRARRARP
jgi:diguanylate cyclase (GGDEF)-like protein